MSHTVKGNTKTVTRPVNITTSKLAESSSRTVLNTDTQIIPDALYIRQLSATDSDNPNAIQSKLGSDTDWVNIDEWPCVLTTQKIFLITNLKFTSNSNYFIIGSDGIEFDGKSFIIELDGFNNYGGLLENGKSSNTATANGKNNIIIKNLGIMTQSVLLANSAGWIGRNYFGKNAKNNQITNCFSTGNINGQYSGGICGANTGFVTANSKLTSSVYITRCYTIGNITDRYSGGIVGMSAGINGGTVNVENCYSIGEISGQEAGGIFGFSAGYNQGNTKVTNCYTMGNITGSGSGGIYGSYAGKDNGKALIFNSYSRGKVLPGANDGFFGVNAGFNSSTDNVKAINSYQATGSWSEAQAKTNLLGYPSETSEIGSVWTSIEINQPFLLSSFDNSNYNLNVLNEFSLTASNNYQTRPGIFDGYKYSLLNVSNSSGNQIPGSTINSTTGVITLPGTTGSGSYIASVVSMVNSNSKFGYNISKYPFKIITTPKQLMDFLKTTLK